MNWVRSCGRGRLVMVGRGGGREAEDRLDPWTLGVESVCRPFLRVD